MTKIGVRGFTLIELLVVIAVIGILSAVILGQLNSARLKGADASKRSSFKNLINRAIFYYETNNESYNAICSDTVFQNIYNGAGGTCNNSALGYRVRVQLQQPNQYSSSSGTDWLCIDATGNLKVLDTDPGGAAITCP